MHICIVTDAWAPQVNGVVRTLETTRRECEALGHRVSVISPVDYHSMPCPTYPEIRLALASRTAIGARIEELAPDALHIATEGPLGIAARGWAVKRGRLGLASRLKVSSRHDRLSHPFPAIPCPPNPSPGGPVLAFHPLVPRTGRRDTGGNRWPAR